VNIFVLHRRGRRSATADDVTILRLQRSSLRFSDFLLRSRGHSRTRYASVVFVPVYLVAPAVVIRVLIYTWLVFTFFVCIFK